MKKILLKILIVLLFLSPALVMDGKNKVAYLVISALVGYSIGIEVMYRLNLKLLISAFISYTVIFTLVNFSFYEDNLSFLMWCMFGSWIAYAGIKSIKKREVVLRGFGFKGLSAIIWGLIAILFSVFILVMERVL